MNKLKITALGLFTLITTLLFGQSVLADKIVGVVGKSAILYSDIEEQYIQMAAQGIKGNKCTIYEDFLSQKLLVTQAEKDSIEVSASEVEMQLEQRMSYFIDQVGSEEKLMEYFGKSIMEIKDDMYDVVREQILMQRMQADIVSDMSVTPKEVESFFKGLDKDSIPYIDSEIELRQIVLYPESDKKAVYEVKEKLLNLRERVLNGESFATMAVLYSEGPSASRGGEIGWINKADLDPAYAKAAAALKKDQVSKIVESSFGYHIIQLLDKTDDRVNTRHILMQPKVTISAKQKANNKLDSIVRLVQLDSISFEKAALYYSQDEDTRMNGGVRVNRQTQTTKFHVDEFSTSEYYILRNLKVGEYSKPFESKDDKGKVVYKIVQLKSRTEPHVANLNQDFPLLKEMASQDKQSELIDKWVIEKAKDTYIRIEPPYDKCDFRLDIWK
jgi:peptidyl-prolyl cis-trans isomerase SurA